MGFSLVCGRLSDGTIRSFERSNRSFFPVEPSDSQTEYEEIVTYALNELHSS